MSTITLRELRKTWDNPETETFADRTEVAAKKKDAPLWSYLPTFGMKLRLNKDDGGRRESYNMAYSRNIDRAIAKYGPDAEFELSKAGSCTDSEPINKGDDHEDLQQGVRAGSNNVPNTSPFTETPGKGGSDCNTETPVGNPRTGGSLTEGNGHGGNTMGGLPATLGEGIPSNRIGENGYRAANSDELGDGTGQTMSTIIAGKTTGVGTQSDTIEEDAFRPAMLNTDGLKTPPFLEANGGTDLTRSSTVWGMYPHPTYSTSFQAFTKLPKYRLPPIKAGSILMGKYVVPDVIELSADGTGFSQENSFGDANPGGHIDAALAKLGSKHLRAQSKSIQSRMELIFRMTEVGVGMDETPRLNSAKLVSELAGKSVRMSRVRKEERGAGLKLILVDVSPSCEAIRDACYAAALGIADADPDVVVFAHFNGYFYMDQSDGEIIVGRRWKELPVIQESTKDEDMKVFEKFLASGKLSGAIAFGDTDAAQLYSVISRYCPMVWLTPDSTKYSVRAAKRYAPDEYSFDKAQLYVVPNVVDARTAVIGMGTITSAIKV